MPIDQVIPGNKHRQGVITALNEPEVQGPHNKTTGPSLSDAVTIKLRHNALA